MAENVYESDKLVREYLLFHYGGAEETLPHAFGPREAVGFPERCVGALLDAPSLPRGARALDVGCAVGRSAFELARHCESVEGIDFSQAFVAAAERVRTEGSVAYEYTIEGARAAGAIARRPEGVDPGRVRFSRGDAMQLPAGIGSFDVVLAANLLCRLPEPRAFLERLPDLVRPGGQLLLATPFSWLEEFTPRGNWIGGRPGAGSREELEAALSPHFELAFVAELPFLIREHARKFQWGVSLGARWVRRR